MVLFKTIIYFIIGLGCFTTSACPSCVARVTKDSPPFFADEFYEVKQATSEKAESVPQATSAQEKKNE